MIVIRELEIDDNLTDDISTEEDQHLISEMRGTSIEDNRASDDDY